VPSLSPRKAAALFFLLSFFITSFFAFLTPPFQVADENGHYLYARSISLGIILPTEFPNKMVGAVLPATETQFANVFSPLRQPDGRLTVAMLKASNAIPFGGPKMITNFLNQATYFPLAYAAPAMTMAVAEALGAGRLTVFYAGRLANAFQYSLLTAIALTLFPAGASAILFAMLLPMSATLAGSLSADAMVISLTTFLTALMARRLAEEIPAPTPLIIAIAFGIAVLSMIKQPMIALLIPFALYAGRRSSMLALLLCVAVACSAYDWSMWVLVNPAQTAKQAAFGVYPALQINYLLTHPFVVFPVALKTFQVLGAEYWQEIVGVMGWLTLRMPFWFYILATIAFAALFLASTTEQRAIRIGRGPRIALLASSVVGVALTFGALYVGWTKPGNPFVTGVQGRYFLPFIAPTVFAVAGAIPRPADERIEIVVFGTAVSGSILAFFVTALTVLVRYWL
jgi:uncharacterized membrane protein